MAPKAKRIKTAASINISKYVDLAIIEEESNDLLEEDELQALQGLNDDNRNDVIVEDNLDGQQEDVIDADSIGNVDSFVSEEGLYDEDGRIIMDKNLMEVAEASQLFSHWNKLIQSSQECGIKNLFNYILCIAGDECKHNVEHFYDLFPKWPTHL